MFRAQEKCKNAKMRFLWVQLIFLTAFLAPGSAQWLATTEVAGHWYVNLDDSTALAFGGGCD